MANGAQWATPYADAVRAYAHRPFVRLDVPGHGGDVVAQRASHLALGRVSADSLAAYPPGIPNVLPGELITPRHSTSYDGPPTRRSAMYAGPSTLSSRTCVCSRRPADKRAFTAAEAILKRRRRHGRLHIPRSQVVMASQTHDHYPWVYGWTVANANAEPPGQSGRRRPECQSAVAADAAYCPNCGADLQPRRGPSGGWIALAVVVALLVGAGIAYALTQGGSSSKTTTAQKTETGSTSIGISVTAPTRTVTNSTTTTTTTAITRPTTTSGASSSTSTSP